jgi:hypothetical protein
MLLAWDFWDGETEKPASDKEMKLFLFDCEDTMKMIPGNEPMKDFDGKSTRRRASYI